MIYRVEIQPTAFQEIETAYRWMCDNRSGDFAARWYYELQDAIQSLERFPNRCAIAPESKTVGREIRQLWVGKQQRYRVMFLVEKDLVAVLHIRHSRQASPEIRPEG